MKGFTLIEVIVAVAISLVITGFVLVNYNSYNDTQTLKQAALTLKNDLRFAQSEAITGVKPTPIPPSFTPVCDELTGFTVSFWSNSYTIRAACNPQGPSGDVKTVTLPPGVTFSPVPPAIAFNVLSRGISLGSGLCLVLSGSGKTYKLGVTNSGDINDFGLQYSGACP